MKFNKIILIGLLLAFISIGAVSAADDTNATDVIQSTSDEMIIEEIQTTDNDDKLTACEEDIVGDVTSDNVTVEVSNVFKGQNTSISVTVLEATGTVNITVGEKLYTPEFVGGVATQNISQYSIGLNNVTVKYNDIVKQTSFKGLDGIVTQETFEDYYEYIQGFYVQSNEVYKHYKLFDYIPEGAVLDFRGLINISNVDYAYGYVDGLTIMSSTKDALIDGNITFNYNYSISDINVTGNLRIYKSTDVRNCNVKTLKISDNNLKDVAIVNVTVSGSTIIRTLGTGGNVSICDSSLLGGLRGYDDDSTDVVPPLTVKNCFIGDGLFGNGVMGGHIIIEDNVINGHIYIRGGDIIIRNNIITASGSKYALDFNNQGNITIVNNTIYNYGYEYAIWVPGHVNVTNNRLFSNNFGNNAIEIYKYAETDTVIIENNTPGQIPIVLTNTKRILYDEIVAISASVSAIGNVTIDINGRKYDLELVNGNADLTINEYLPGTNIIRVYYSDAVNDIYGYADATFYVEKIDKCPVDLIYSDIIEGKISSVNVILPDDAKGIITFRIFNPTLSVKVVQNANGRENIILMPDLTQGEYMMNVTFTSDKYVTNSSSGNISFIHNPVYKLTANDIVMDYKDGSKYKVLVTKDGKVAVGEVVKITFNGKTINVKTDKNGYATLTLDGAPKTYTIKAVYNGVTKSSKVTIKNVLKAKNISKKKAKTVKFQATLKTSKGKAITGKKVTFKLKGKTYSAKTNKKGVATVSIKNLKVGKYTITSKYGLCTVKNTITIKK